MLKHAIPKALIMLGLTTILFVLVNLMAFVYIQWLPSEVFDGKGEDILSYAIGPRSAEGQAILVPALGPQMAARISAAYDNLQYPPFAPHPTLHYIYQPTKNNHYTVGREGIRYINGWTDDDATALLQSTKKKVFLLGGSTTFGHGVGDDDTIAAHLQKQLGDDYAVFNFGTGAYDQTREIDRLLYQLRQGYRPDVVIFLDGLNDSFTFARSNYRVEDKIIYHGFMAGRGGGGEVIRHSLLIRDDLFPRVTLPSCWLTHFHSRERCSRVRNLAPT